MTDCAIEAVGLSKKFLMSTERRTSLKERLVRGRAPVPKTFWALKDATFSVPKGSSLGIIGHNGSGKSTALKVLTGIYRPTSGTVRVNGSVSALLEVGAGFHPELTGRENIRLNATILGFTNREIDRFMDQIIEFADIGEHIDAPLKHYSSGMHVRLGFAVAVMVRPEILIVDEVIAVGDEEFQRKCYDYLEDLRRGGTSMIIVSHGLSQISNLCDEAIQLERGRVVQHGPSNAVVRAYLDGVNQAEVERSEGATTDHREVAVAETGDTLIGRELNHRGSGQVRVHSVEFLDGTGQPATFLVCGDPARIRLAYSATEAIGDLQFGLGFDDSSQITACTLYTQPDALVAIEPGTGTVEFYTDAFLLSAGVYRVRLGVTRRMHVIDAIDDGLKVTVRESGAVMNGMYFQPGTWTVNVDSDLLADGRR